MDNLTVLAIAKLVSTNRTSIADIQLQGPTQYPDLKYQNLLDLRPELQVAAVLGYFEAQACSGTPTTRMFLVSRRCSWSLPIPLVLLIKSMDWIPQCQRNCVAGHSWSAWTGPLSRSPRVLVLKSTVQLFSVGTHEISQYHPLFDAKCAQNV